VSAILRRFGVLGAGIGSQIFIDQLLAYSAGVSAADLWMIGLAVILATLAAVVPRVLSGPAERPAVIAVDSTEEDRSKSGLASPEIAMGLQAAIASGVGSRGR
jgi:hypothetical protein